MGFALLILLIVALAIPAAARGNRPATTLLWLGGSFLWLMGALAMSLVCALMLGMAGLGDDYLAPVGLGVGGTVMALVTIAGYRAGSSS
ncbi:membrane hypothetical protein [Pseudomonas sp. 8Z]|uniref:hypothetical protein n=1 Tax=Pseudomonas sp. 8Z TaxID=2653166 RepID=UPI0012EF0431|nr:hypothetical protein [Pseudomonas sp. 8Z]VXC68527.1 membrane hypothetical protein [Pseudomonas sp. 8Z]